MTTTPIHEKEFPMDEKIKLPRAFILRRLHSLLGVWLVVYLFEHLLVNSQAALYFEDGGIGFISKVNQIHALPYLPAIEILFLGVPFLIHGVWGVIYLWTAKSNSTQSDGTKPSLPQYKRNHAYTWQRVTSWILVLGILAHVIHMRFLVYPAMIHQGMEKIYFTPLNEDPGLSSVAKKLNVMVLNQSQLLEKKRELDREKKEENVGWLEGALKKPLKEGQVLAIAPNAGIAFLLILRDTFKSPAMVILYSLLVVVAAYHACNGLWTFMITWGVTLTRRSQKSMRTIATVLMALVTILGLMAVWGTYLTTLK